MPPRDATARNLTALLDAVERELSAEGRVSVRAVLESFGPRSFGSIVLLAGLVTVTPLVGDIPGVPTIFGVIVFLVSTQLIAGRHAFWLPQRLLDRSVSHATFCRVLNWLRTPAKHTDRMLRTRLRFFFDWAGKMLIALMCTLVALAMPIMEFIPFSANLAGLALTAYGLGLIAYDGIFALIGHTTVLGTAAAVVLVFL